VTLSYLVHKRKLLVVMAYRLLPIQQHEVTVSDERLDEVLTAMGDGALIDHGFLNEKRLGRWQTSGMDVLVPVKHNMAVLADMQRLAKLPADAHFVQAERCRAKKSHARLQFIQSLIQAVVQPLPSLCPPLGVAELFKRKDRCAGHCPVLHMSKVLGVSPLSLLTCGAGACVLKNKECSQLWMP